MPRRGASTRGRKASFDPSKVKQMKADGMGPSGIAKTLKIGRASVYRALASVCSDRGLEAAIPLDNTNRPLSTAQLIAALIAADQNGVTFNYKDYRADGQARYKVMTLTTSEFIRRFLSHVLPKGFHRIRYYGLLAKSSCAENLARARQLLAVPKPQVLTDNDGGPTQPSTTAHPCPCCGGRMIIIEAFAPGCQPHHRPSATTIAIRIDTS